MAGSSHPVQVNRLLCRVIETAVFSGCFDAWRLGGSYLDEIIQGFVTLNRQVLVSANYTIPEVKKFRLLLNDGLANGLGVRFCNYPACCRRGT
jgi:hypothetical protein